MQIGSRFTEYGLTGGFFWICQFIFLWRSGQTQTLLGKLSTVQNQIPEHLPIAITSLVSALAIIAVFVTGLLLDLLAGYFRPLEMGVFHKHLVRNRDWLGRLIANHKGYCEADYEEFERQFDRTSPPSASQKRLFAVLKRAWVAGPYERLWSFFTSYIFVESGSLQLSLMVDQYYLWRTGRAVSVSLIILLFETSMLTYFLVVSHRSLHPFLQLFLPGGLSVVSFIITRQIYSRLCFTLFALVYVTQDKAQRGV